MTDSMTVRRAGQWVQLERLGGAWCLNGAYMGATAAVACQAVREGRHAGASPYKRT